MSIYPKYSSDGDPVEHDIAADWLHGALFAELHDGRWVLNDALGISVEKMDPHLQMFGYTTILFESAADLDLFLDDDHSLTRKTRAFVQRNRDLSGFGALVGDEYRKLLPPRARIGLPPENAETWMEGVLRTPVQHLEHIDAFSLSVLPVETATENLHNGKQDTFRAVQEWNATILNAAYLASRGEPQAVLPAMSFDGCRSDLLELRGEASDHVLLVPESPRFQVLLAEPDDQFEAEHEWFRRSGVAYRLPLRTVRNRMTRSRCVTSRSTPLDVEIAARK